MTPSNAPDRNRLYELLADEASAALDSSDAPELARLLEHQPLVTRDEMLKAAALAQVAFQRRATVSRMPDGLKKRLASQGEALVIGQRGPAPVVQLAQTKNRPATATGRQTTSRWSRFNGGGWALAAMLAVAFVVVRNEPTTVAPAPDNLATRTSLLNEAPDVITLPWAPPTATGYQGVTGDVVWSQSRQQGYLRLANMPVNDPARSQYQLWIVDPERDTRPVDGGVFNVSGTGEVIIPIQAKLLIRSPTAFAITAEQPGGVVVSAGPLLVVASI
jgi:anti-sigma-K factor RskA